MWNTLSESQKMECIKYCNIKYGSRSVYCETGEPMYLDEKGNLIDITIIIELLFRCPLN